MATFDETGIYYNGCKMTLCEPFDRCKLKVGILIQGKCKFYKFDTSEANLCLLKYDVQSAHTDIDTGFTDQNFDALDWFEPYPSAE